MNPYGDGRTPRPYPGGQYHQGGNPQPQPGYQQFGGPGHPQPTQQFGYPPAGPPPGGPRPPNRGPGKGVIIAGIAVVAVLAVAAAIVAGLVLREDSATQASPVTFSATTSPAPGAAGTTAPGAATTSAAPGAARTPGTETDGFLTPSRPSGAPSTSTAVPLKLSAGGAGAGAVVVSGVPGSTVPPVSVLPWEWQGRVVIGESLTVQVVGSGPVSCSISVDGREISRRDGTNTVQCGIKRR